MGYLIFDCGGFGELQGDSETTGGAASSLNLRNARGRYSYHKP